MSWEPIFGSHFGSTHCAGCGTYVVSVEAEQGNAKCIECGRAGQGVTWEASVKVGDWHPTVGYPSPGHGPLAPEQAEKAPYPAPTVTSSQGLAPEPPTAFRALHGEMRAAGWRILVQYAHGSMPHSTLGTPLATKDSWALRVQHADGRHACAVYRGDAWGSLFTWGNGETPHQHANVTAFRAAVLS